MRKLGKWILYVLGGSTILLSIAPFTSNEIVAGVIVCVFGLIFIWAGKIISKPPQPKETELKPQVATTTVEDNGTEPVQAPEPGQPTEPEPEQVRCPKCRSTQLSFDKKGYGVGKAAAGVLLTGGIGLLAGGIGKGKYKITCMACGHVWKPGKA